MKQKKKNQSTHQPTDIAVIGMSCWYPGAQNLLQFWENILGKRQQFRRMLDGRLPIADYHNPNRQAPDKTYGDKAAFLEGFEFDWMSEKFPKSTYDSTDLVHWLALDLAGKAIHDAGMTRKSIPLNKTGVIVGNSLTGESSRSNGMRLRWPYIQKVLAITAQNRGLNDEQIKDFIKSTEELYKSLFAPITEDTLAGSLANTIAGRICNYFNLDGGGFTVDGACASSLLAVANSASALASGDLDLAVVGGVDVSLDSFELIGFSKVGALAEKEMKVYDRDGKGFLPGEGCGFVLLKRLDDALRDQNKVYAVLKGWGISSDGSGGITAPKASGQAIALKRAYERAGYKASACDFMEGHGTGTAVGDKRELEGISIVMNEMGDVKPKSTGMTSLKSIVGHTKAAAGIGAFIKAVIAVNRRVLPPTAGCENPNAIFDQQAHMLYPLVQGEVRPETDTLRAGVSAMGFGGINCHVTLESFGTPSPELAPSLPERSLMASHSEAELFIFTAQSISSLKQQIQAQLQEAPFVSLAEMADLSHHLSQRLMPTMPYRAALLASNPVEFNERLKELDQMLATAPGVGVGVGEMKSNELQSVWISNRMAKPRVGFLFPGQGSQKLGMTKHLVERFPWAQQFVAQADQWLKPQLKHALSDWMHKQALRATSKEELAKWSEDLAQTSHAQPAICLSSVIWAKRLTDLGIHCQVVAGHSLGELTALHWAGAYSQQELMELAALRGHLMSAASGSAGTMVSLTCDRETAEKLMSEITADVVVANINSAQQTVLSGPVAQIEEIIKVAGQKGITAHRLNVSNAFHSPMVAEAAKKLQEKFLLANPTSKLKYKFISGSEGNSFDEQRALKDYLPKQIVSPVNFVDVIQKLAPECDLLIEVGHGGILTGLAKSILGKSGPICLPVEAKTEKHQDFLRVIAQFFASGGQVHFEKLFEYRLVRPYTSFKERQFLTNPCEKPFPQALIESIHQRALALGGVASQPVLAKAAGQSHVTVITPSTPVAPTEAAGKVIPLRAEGPSKDLSREEVKSILLEILCQVTGFPADIFKMEMRLLDDLNLDSIKAGEAITALVQRCSIQGALDPIQIANATLDEIIDIIVGMGPKSPGSSEGNSGGSSSGSAAPVGGGQTPPPALSGGGSMALAAPPVVAAKVERDILTVLTETTCKISGYSLGSFSPQMELISELRLTDKQFEEIVQESCLLLGLRPTIDLQAIRNASIQSLAVILEKLKKQQAETVPAVVKAPDIKPWVRNFVMSMNEKPRQARAANHVTRHNDQWSNAKILVLRSDDTSPLADALVTTWTGEGASVSEQTFASVSQLSKQQLSEFNYVICFFPEKAATAPQQQERIQAAIQRLHFLTTIPNMFSQSRRTTTLACIQFADGRFGTGSFNTSFEQSSISAFLQTLHIERSDLRIRCIDVALGLAPQKATEEILQDLVTDEPFKMIGFTLNGERMEPSLDLSQPTSYQERKHKWSPKDVMLVTGGAKGITAECAYAFAQKTGVRLAIVGSSKLPPASSPEAQTHESAQNLKRFETAKISFRYYSCDVSDLDQMKATIEKIQSDMGPITAVLHGAGRNIPRRLSQVSPQDAYHEISPKLMGAINLCQILPAKELKLFSAFTSILGMMGVPGTGWYGFSNEALNLHLKKYREQNPNVDVLTLAYGMWNEVGMASKLGSGDKFSSMGVRLIPVEEGVGRFLHLMLHDPGTQQIAITSSLWKQSLIQSKRKVSDKHRFTEGLLHCTEGVEAVSRVRLSLERDLYLHDHQYAGVYLFPTVFGMEAMAQVAAHVLNVDHIDHLIGEKIELTSAISVDPKKGTGIEVYAIVQESTGPSKDKLVKVGVRSETSKFLRDSFSAYFRIPEKSTQEISPLRNTQPDLKIDLKQAVYGPLLFHGPAYQRLKSFYDLNSKSLIFATQYEEPTHNQKQSFSDGKELILGDPFFRDTLLQAGQSVTTKQISLPSSCEKWEVFNTRAKPGLKTGFYKLVSHDGKKPTHTITCVDENGQVLERLTHCQSVVTKQIPQNLSAEEIVAKYSTVQRPLSVVVDQLMKEMKIEGLTLHHDQIKNLKSLSLEERHAQEKQKALCALEKHGTDSLNNVELKWKSSGKPYLEGLSQKLEISFSHVGDRCLCALHPRAVGCDVEMVSEKSQKDWETLLGPQFAEAFKEMQGSGTTAAQTNLFGTMVWSAREAASKAVDSKQIGISSHRSVTGGYAFNFVLEQTHVQVICVEHSLESETQKFVVAVAVQAPESASSATSFDAPGANLDGASEVYSLGVHPDKGFFARWPVTFKDAGNIRKGVYFSKFVEWQGRARELAIMPLLGSSSKIFGNGTAGWVTNSSEVRLYKSAEVGDVIEARLTSGLPHGKSNSSVEILYDWYRITNTGEEELIAQSQMMTTWVKIISHGVVEAAPFPQEFQNFFSSVARTEVPQLETASSFTEPSALYEAPAGITTGPVLSEHVFDTALEDSNLVGNIYFSNYSSWLGKTRDIFFHRVIPEIMQAHSTAEMFCTKSHIKHLRELMPFDQVQVVMRLKAMGERSLKLYFEFYKYSDGKRMEKIAYADHQVVWSRSSRNELEAEPLPPILIYYLKKAIHDQPVEIRKSQAA